MRYKKKIPARVEEREVTTRTLCDCCNKNVAEGGAYECNDVTIEALIGSIYPDYDARTRYRTDICGECFLGKVLPALAGLGIKVRIKEDIDDTDDREWDPEEAPTK